MKKLLIIFSIIFLVSCQKETQINPYVGNWHYDTVVDFDTTKTSIRSLQHYMNVYGEIPDFSILNDSIINVASGFYYNIRNIVKTNGGYNPTHLRSSYYLGTQTKCRIDKSKIEFFNKTSREWDTIKVKRINGDTLIVEGKEGVTFRMLRKPEKKSISTAQYDAIIVDRSPCFGSCPFNSTYIDRKGNFYFRASDSNTQYGVLAAKLDTETLKDVFDEFDKIDFTKLKDSYSGSGTCGPTETITFFKDNQIVKTIECYRAGPQDLVNAYIRLSYLYQQVNVDHDNQFFFGDEHVRFNFFKDKKIVGFLDDSESFYLEVALRKGKKVTQNFVPKYHLDFHDYNEVTVVKKITTDGRIYKIDMRDGTAVTIDIGYNFVDSNPIIKQNRDY